MPRRAYLNFWENRNFDLKIDFSRFWLFSSAKKRVYWAHILLKIFCKNCFQGLKITESTLQVCISNVLGALFRFKASFVKKSIFEKKSHSNRLKSTQKQQKVTRKKLKKSWKFFFLPNRFQCILIGPDGTQTTSRTPEHLFWHSYMPRRAYLNFWENRNFDLKIDFSRFGCSQAPKMRVYGAYIEL